MSSEIQNELLFKFGLRFTILVFALAIILPRLVDIVVYYIKAKIDLKNHESKMALETKQAQDIRIAVLRQKFHDEKMLEVLTAMWVHGEYLWIDEKMRKESHNKSNCIKIGDGEGIVSYHYLTYYPIIQKLLHDRFIKGTNFVIKDLVSDLLQPRKITEFNINSHYIELSDSGKQVAEELVSLGLGYKRRH